MSTLRIEHGDVAMSIPIPEEQTVSQTDQPLIMSLWRPDEGLPSGTVLGQWIAPGDFELAGVQNAIGVATSPHLSLVVNGTVVDGFSLGTSEQMAAVIREGDIVQLVYGSTEPEDLQSKDITVNLIWAPAVLPDLPPAGGYFLDGLAMPKVALSLVQLRETSTHCVRIRTDDGQLHDIGFTDGICDFDEILQLAGTGAARVDMWFDQSNNARHFTAANANLPLIAAGGAIMRNMSGHRGILSTAGLSTFEGIIPAGLSRVLYGVTRNDDDHDMLLFSENGGTQKYFGLSEMGSQAPAHGGVGGPLYSTNGLVQQAWQRSELFNMLPDGNMAVLEIESVDAFSDVHFPGQSTSVASVYSHELIIWDEMGGVPNRHPDLAAALL